MQHLHIDDYVRLRNDLPDLDLQRGTIGVVRSTWFAPQITYEVEFHQIGLTHQTRALVTEEQLQREDGPLFDPKRLKRLMQ